MLRLETLAGMSGELPMDSIRRQIATAIHLVVQIHRQGKTRYVSSISQVLNYDDARGVVCVKDIFKRCPVQTGGKLLPTGCLPTFMPALVQMGLLDLDVFFAASSEPK